MADVAALWGKTASNGRYHPLACHMLDVAAVAGLLWDHSLTPGLRKRLERALGAADARTQAVFLAGAHDVGKACPGFQKKMMPELCECSKLPFSCNDQDRPHGFVSAHALNELLGSRSASSLLSRIAGGHHGVFPRSENLQLGADTLGNRYWGDARNDLLRTLARLVGRALERAAPDGSEVIDPFVVPVLAGFVSVADWVGSNQEFFPCAAECGKVVEQRPDNYWKKAQRQAQEALEALGWQPNVTFAAEVAFDKVFRDFLANDLQERVIGLTSGQTSPYLMIVEAPMGRGKTEAALYAADLALCRGFARGMYVAMPTQATSNAMFKRVLDDYLKHRGHRGKLNLQLVHGDALLAQIPEVREGEIPDYAPVSIGEQGGDVEAQSWFTARKRPLLAPFGVGTIDQGLLSVLQTRHWFVRLFGLAGKVVVFDEVHACDAYMGTILERLLHWLAELDCTVILLSATLPEAKRKALVRAFSGRDDAEYARYPRITLAKARHYAGGQAEQGPVCREAPMADRHAVEVRFAKTDLGSLTETLFQRLEHGGCAAVICNTVDRSIEVYNNLHETLKDTECLLFHARTLQVWRREREEEVLHKFGKRNPQETDAEGHFANADRPSRAVLVATQVIEQSLDLDFDVMVSEIAPIDLLLQRSGRLHRHPRRRPQGLETPQLLVLCDAEREGPPPETFGKNIEHVYDRYVLLRTWLALRERDRIEVPLDIEALIEAVYGGGVQDAAGTWEEALGAAKDRMERERSESQKAARGLLVSEPTDPSELIEQFNPQLAEDEDPEVHKTVRAATREGDPSITVVTLPEDTVLSDPATIREVRWLLDHSVKLSRRGLFQALLEDGETPAEWARCAHLQHARLVRLNAHDQGRVGPYLLTVDRKRGVLIAKEEA